MVTENNKPLRVSDLERITGINRSTIHYYLREGLLSEPMRTSKTMAYYTSNHLEELEEVRRLQEEGYPITFIRNIMSDFRRERSNPQHQVESPEEKKSQILKAAVDVFTRKGYYKTKMSDIAESVGVGHSTLYLYFPNKETLFTECVDEVQKAMLDEINKDVEGIRNPVTRIMKIAYIVMKSYPQMLEILHVLENAAGENPGLMEKRKEVCTRGASVVKDNVDQAVADGIIPAVDSTMISYIAIGVAEGISRLISLDDHYTFEGIVLEMVQSYINALGNRDLVKIVEDNKEIFQQEL